VLLGQPYHAFPPGIGAAVEKQADSEANRRTRLRYGFVANYGPDQDVAGMSDLVRRLHLTGVQFHDWAYRHADLLGGGDAYDDALGRTISRSTILQLVDAVQNAGSRALGYAAVYAVGNAEWKDWQHQALLQADGKPYALSDFLSIVDPAASDWPNHFCQELKTATATFGFDLLP
jgi:dextranase